MPIKIDPEAYYTTKEIKHFRIFETTDFLKWIRIKYGKEIFRFVRGNLILEYIKYKCGNYD